MRKIKKINGFLIVKFNTREQKAWEDTGLGNYGILDAELYTGCLDIDRSAMEYDDILTLEIATELVGILNADKDYTEVEPTFLVVTETNDDMVETVVEPKKMAEHFETELRGQIENPRYPEVTPSTARHQLFGYLSALEDLNVLDESECIVGQTHFGKDEVSQKSTPCLTVPDLVEELFTLLDQTLLNIPETLKKELTDIADTFGIPKELRIDTEENRYIEEPRAMPFYHIEDKTKRMKGIFEIGLLLRQKCPPNDCSIYLRIFNECQNLDGQLGSLHGAARDLLQGRLQKSYAELEIMYLTNHAIRNLRRELQSRESVHSIPLGETVEWTPVTETVYDFTVCNTDTEDEPLTLFAQAREYLEILVGRCEEDTKLRNILVYLAKLNIREETIVSNPASQAFYELARAIPSGFISFDVTVMDESTLEIKCLDAVSSRIVATFEMQNAFGTYYINTLKLEEEASYN